MVKEESRAMTLGLKAGDWVEVRGQAEILATLDMNGRLGELPFMPQMFQYCSKKFQVAKRIHKLCCIVADTIGRQLEDVVSLAGLRCDGKDYGGCEMACMILWKEAWLVPLDPTINTPGMMGTQRSNGLATAVASGCSVVNVLEGTRSRCIGTAEGNQVYVCQATQLPYATEPLSQWAPRQYIQDYLSGNVRMSKIISRVLFQFYCHYLVSSRLGLGTLFQWIFNAVQGMRGGPPFPWKKGAIPKDRPTPSVNLDLRVGEFVRVREYRDIRTTLDEDGKNRGMVFHPELSRHCGKVFRVSRRIRKVMNENTGQLIELKNSCIVLDGADCDGVFTNPLNCPRAAYPYWREIWLERMPQSQQSIPNENHQ